MAPRVGLCMGQSISLFGLLMSVILKGKCEVYR